MPQTSAHDRRTHQQVVRTLLGEDLWISRDGSPRLRMNDQHVTRAINDGNHEPARQVLAAMLRLFPLSTRMSDEWGYAHYGIVGSDSDHIEYRTPTYREGRHADKPISRATLLNHLFGVESVLPSFKLETRFDSLLIDVDVDMWGDSIDLFTLPQSDLVEIIAPWHSTLTRLGVPARYMLSGNRGFWIQILLDEPIHRYRMENLYHTICRSAGARRDGSDYHLPGEYIGYVAESGNLSDHVCRLPWSLREDNDNVSVHVHSLSGCVDPSGILFSEELQVSALPALFYATCGCVCQDEVGHDDTDQEQSPTSTVSYATCGCVCQQDDDTTDDADDEITPPEHLDWDWSSVEMEANGGDSIHCDTWDDAILTDVESGDRWNVLANGNIALVSGRMLHDLGHIDWEELKAAYRLAYPEQNRKGGTTDKWVDDWRRMSHEGRDVVPCPPSLTPDGVERCRRYADDIVAGITGRTRRPKVDDIYHVLLVLCRFTHVGNGEISTDFLARKAGINPYRTWEAQVAAEGVEENGDDVNHHVRHNRTSRNSRDRLMRVLSYVCDLDPDVVTGHHPFHRTAIGTNDHSDPRVVERDRPVGSEFERVDNHPLWV